MNVFQAAFFKISLITLFSCFFFLNLKAFPISEGDSSKTTVKNSNREVKSFDPSSGSVDIRKIKERKESVRLFQKTKPFKVESFTKGIVTGLLLLPLGAVFMFIAGLLAPIFGLWLAGLIIWGLAVLLLSIVFFGAFGALKKDDNPKKSGMAGIFSLLVSVYAIILSLIGGLVALIWGLLISMPLMWIVGAFFTVFGLILLIFGIQFFQKL